MDTHCLKMLVHIGISKSSHFRLHTCLTHRVTVSHVKRGQYASCEHPDAHTDPQSTRVCMYVCVRVCMYMYIYICVCVCVWVGGLTTLQCHWFAMSRVGSTLPLLTLRCGCAPKCAIFRFDGVSIFFVLPPSSSSSLRLLRPLSIFFALSPSFSSYHHLLRPPSVVVSPSPSSYLHLLHLRPPSVFFVLPPSSLSSLYLLSFGWLMLVSKQQDFNQRILKLDSKPTQYQVGDRFHFSDPKDGGIFTGIELLKGGQSLCISIGYILILR
jgi:hypothetical protein